MAKCTFPIVDIRGNKLFSVDNNVGLFYELDCPDIFQLTDYERNRFYNSISNSLNNLDESSYFKFYSIDGHSYLETNSIERPILQNIELKDSNDHLDTFFGSSELFSSVGIYDDYINYNGRYIKIVSVKEFSSDPIDESLIPIDVDYVLVFKRLNNNISLKRLDGIRTKHLSSFNKAKRDIKSEGAYSQAENLIEEITSGNESLFEMEMYFLIKGSSLEEVNNQFFNFQNFMISRGVKTFLEGNNFLKLKSGLGSIFNQLIPGVRPELKLRSHLNKTGHLRYLLPLKQSKLMNEGVCFCDQSDNLISFNPFEKSIKNRNMLVTGLSGGGKSVFVNKLLHKLIDKHPVVILDKGGSFRKLATYHNGVVLNGGFNPLQFLDASYLRELILSMVDKNKFSKLERGKLLRTIKEFLASKNDRSFDNLLKSLEKDFSGISFYFEDIKSYFNEGVIKECPILYVDIENYPKSFISPLIIFILQYFKELSQGEKILVIDECWSFLKDHSEFVEECFRTFRKTGAFPIAISQGIDDFKGLKGDLTTSITSNSYFKVYFPQELSTNGSIDDFDLENICQLEFEKGSFSDCYLKTSDNKYRKIIRNYLTPLELELFHTESGGDEMLEKFIKNNGEYFQSNKDAIDAFVGLKYAKDNYNFNDDKSFLWN